MTWQDLVLTAGSIFFTIALMPTIFDKGSRIPRLTSVTTAFWCLVFGATQWTLGLRFAPICEVICAGCWAFIAWRRAPLGIVFALCEQLNADASKKNLPHRWSPK